MERELIVVSNRLPLVIDQTPDGGWEIEAGSGGLIQALEPVLNRRGGKWIGWPGVSSEDADGWRARLESFAEDVPFEYVPVPLSEDEFEGYYAGFANAVLWPLFHGFPERCEFNPDFWATYEDVNRRFAEAIDSTIDDEILWVQDYHLMRVPEHLPDQGGPRRGFFLHIPFPGPDNYSKLPWRDEILEGLLGYDLVGLQSRRDLQNLTACCRRLYPDIDLECDDTSATIHRGDRATQVGVFPIGCNADSFESIARSGDLTQNLSHLRDSLGPYDMLLGIDRLDYTKGLIHRFKAFERALEKHPSLRERVVLYQLVVPSRESVSEYRNLKEQLDQTIGRIEGRFSTSEWNPIRYRYDSVSMEELTGLYRYANTGLVTPVYDGMNLVAKEFCAAQIDETGALVLSEFAGAADQLGDDAVLVNPYDIEQTADAIHDAVTMPRDERVRRMRRLRQTVSEQDVFWWAGVFLDELLGE